MQRPGAHLRCPEAGSTLIPSHAAGFTEHPPPAGHNTRNCPLTCSSCVSMGSYPLKCPFPHHLISTRVPRSTPAHTGCSSARVTLYSAFISPFQLMSHLLEEALWPEASCLLPSTHSPCVPSQHNTHHTALSLDFLGLPVSLPHWASNPLEFLTHRRVRLLN